MTPSRHAALGIAHEAVYNRGASAPCLEGRPVAWHIAHVTSSLPTQKAKYVLVRVCHEISGHNRKIKSAALLRNVSDGKCGAS